MNSKKAMVYLAAGMTALSMMGMPASVKASVWSSRVSLPSAGVSYALSAKKVSLSDVKTKVDALERVKASAKTSAEASGTTAQDVLKPVGASMLTAVKMTASRTETAIEKSDAASAQKQDDTNAASGENTDSASASDTAADGIMETTLTPVQEKEHKAVRQAETSTESGIKGEVTESEAIAAAATAPSMKEEDTASDTAASDNTTSADSAKTDDSANAAQASDAASSAGTEAASQSNTATSENNAADTGSSQQNSSEGSTLVASTASDFVYIRKEASQDSEILGKLYANSVGEILAEADENGWIKIKSGDVTGYVKKDYVAEGSKAQEIADNVSKKQATVTTTTLRVRAAADPESDVISLIGKGEQLDIIKEENGWYKVNTADGEGYISADFADVEQIYPEAVSIETERREQEEKEAEEKAEKEAKQKSTSSKSSASGSSKSTGSTASPKSSGSTSGSSQGQAVVNYAMQFIGNPYVWGGSSLTNGTDCSGFTMSVYSHFGVSLPHYDGAQRSCGTAVSSLAEAQPGDLICYYGHVGIYIGNGQIVHASNPRTGITTGSATYRQIAAIRRIF
ncbi:MAG: SH3 domain-containing C40 family peptidase [Firmicutes bacterium]|nr:SH3 domain-containing C40 family peptidase [Bacillota bacterium]